MRTLTVLLLMSVIFAGGQCMAPIKAAAGMQIGLNYGIFDPDDGAGTMSGAGFQFGLGMGMEILGTLGIQVTPSFKTTEFSREILNIPTGARYSNFFLPVHVQIKAGMIPVVSPYLGLGIAYNSQLSGTGYIGELESSIEDLENDTYFSLALGADIKLIKLKIVPEFCFNYNLTADDGDTPNRSEQEHNFHFSIGLFYTP
jgi:hypothetical protein